MEIDSRTARHPERKLFACLALLYGPGERQAVAGAQRANGDANLTQWHVPMITAVEPDLLLPAVSILLHMPAF